jgi:gas vesicle protein
MLEASAKEKASLDQSAVFTAKRRKEMGEAIDRLAFFLEHKLQDHHERFVQDLSASRDVLTERLKRAIERGSTELNHIITGWKRIHWCTLRAISRRAGRFTSPTSGHYDLPREIAKPILDGITFAWTDFFGDQMKQRLERWSEKLVMLAQQHGIDLLKDLSRIVPASQEQLHKDFESMVEHTERVTNELLAQARSHMLATLEEVRRDLYDEIPYQIAVDMKQAFLDAANEKGTGMKMRMIDLIAAHATNASADMFSRTEERISQGVRELVEQLARDFGGMTATVQRHAGLPVDNLINAEKLPQDEIKLMQQAVSTLAAAAQELREDPLILGQRVYQVGAPEGAAAC